MDGPTHALTDCQGCNVVVGLNFLLRLLHLQFQVGLFQQRILNLAAALACLHRVQRRLLDDVVMLDADYLVDSVTQTSHLLTALVQSVLREAVLDDAVVVVLPCIFLAQRCKNFELLFVPVPLRTWHM